jgi:hypothetical protein
MKPLNIKDIGFLSLFSQVFLIKSTCFTSFLISKSILSDYKDVFLSQKEIRLSKTTI